MFGKTEKTDGDRHAWFVGLTGDGITTGIWIGAPSREWMEAVSGRMVLALTFLHYSRNLHERLRG